MIAVRLQTGPAKPEARDEQYGHLTVEDDPEGTTDEAELLSRHPSPR